LFGTSDLIGKIWILSPPGWVKTLVKLDPLDSTLIHSHPNQLLQLECSIYNDQGSGGRPCLSLEQEGVEPEKNARGWRGFDPFNPMSVYGNFLGLGRPNPTYKTVHEVFLCVCPVGLEIDTHKRIKTPIPTDKKISVSDLVLYTSSD
jgi:hypothetical protein